eukprot:463833-Pleurochrysis_carterae.AAC.1
MEQPLVRAEAASFRGTRGGVRLPQPQQRAGRHGDAMSAVPKGFRRMFRSTRSKSVDRRAENTRSHLAFEIIILL